MADFSMLGEADIARYARQILLREVGGAGQEKLLTARWEAGGDVALYLRAGGCPLAPEGERARVRGDIAEVTIEKIGDEIVISWSRAPKAARQLHPDPPLLASAWAALIAQRLTLGTLATEGELLIHRDGTTELRPSPWPSPLPGRGDAL